MKLHGVLSVISFLSVFSQMHAPHIAGGKVLSEAGASGETSPHDNTVSEAAPASGPALSIRSEATEPAAVPVLGKGK